MDMCFVNSENEVNDSRNFIKNYSLVFYKHLGNCGIGLTTEVTTATDVHSNVFYIVHAGPVTMATDVENNVFYTALVVLIIMAADVNKNVFYTVLGGNHGN